MNTYVRHLKVTDLESIFAYVREPKGHEKTRIDLNGHSVGVSSLRLRTFKQAWQSRFCCVGCGKVPTHFAVEVDAWAPKGTKPHLNLYGEDETLFTHDHILARGLGGKDNISNTQLMCSPCNAEKAKGEQLLVNKLKMK